MVIVACIHPPAIRRWEGGEVKRDSRYEDFFAGR